MQRFYSLHGMLAVALVCCFLASASFPNRLNMGQPLPAMAETLRLSNCGGVSFAQASMMRGGSKLASREVGRPDARPRQRSRRVKVEATPLPSAGTLPGDDAGDAGISTEIKGDGQEGGGQGGIFDSWKEKGFTKEQIKMIKSHSQRLKQNKTMPRMSIKGQELEEWNVVGVKQVLHSKRSCRFVSVKFLEVMGRSPMKDAAEELAKALGADVVQVVGHVVVLCHGISPDDPLFELLPANKKDKAQQ